MRLKISYTTTYSYDTPVPYALQQLRMTPRNARGQEIVSWELSVAGGTKQVSFEDQFKNVTSLISMEPEASVIEIRCEGEVETSDHNGIIGKHKGFAPLWLFLGPTEFTSPGSSIRKLAVKVRHEDLSNDLESLHFLSNAIGGAVKYETGRTDSTTNAEEALVAGHGVCQDHSHIMIATARLLGFPARYVSGYLMMNDRGAWLGRFRRV
jgi:transglutaminase-like putative cysteine protease